MPFSIKIIFICLGMAALSLALGYGLQWMGFWAVLLGLPLVVGWLGWRQNWQRALPGVILLDMVVACLGILVGISPGWMIAGFVFAFTARDLAKLRQRLQNLDRQDMVIKIERGYVRWLVVVNGIGLLLAELALLIRLKLGFGLLFLTGILVILALSRLVAVLRQSRP